MQSATPPIPVCEVQGEVFGWIPVVHIMVLYCIHAAGALQAVDHQRQHTLQCRYERGQLIPGMARCNSISNSTH